MLNARLAAGLRLRTLGRAAVVVDLVVTTADPLQSWDVHPATSVAGVITIDATGWTPQVELLAWVYDKFGVGEAPPAALSSYYNCSLLDWGTCLRQLSLSLPPFAND